MSTGYRNPPKNTQFRKGRSGNPSGRPKQNQRPISVGSLFRKVAREQVPIEVDGIKVTISYWDAYVRQVYTMALNKNNRAARLLDQLRRQFPGDLLPGDPVRLLISEDDARLLTSRRRISCNDGYGTSSLAKADSRRLLKSTIRLHE